MNSTLSRLLTAILVFAPALAQAQAATDNKLSWSSAMGGGDAISAWVKTSVLAIMAVFVMVSIILGSLAFKQLAADGNWKEFWSKIAGSIGMFVVPIAIYWIITKS